MKLIKKYFLPLLILLLITCTVGGTVAYIIDVVDPVTNTFSPAKVDGEVTEDFNGSEKTNIKVKNIGTADAYIRVKLVAYWYAKDTDTIIAKNSWLDETTLTPVNNWIRGNDGYYYYPTVITPNASTEILFSEAIKLKADAQGNRQVLEVLAEAIQAVPADAVEDAWPAVDVSGGKLIAAS